MSEKMWGAEPFWGLGYEWDPDWVYTDRQKEFRRSIVFAGQLVFQRETIFTRTLHHETAFSIQRRLQFAGIQVIILPIRVWQKQRTA